MLGQPSFEAKSTSLEREEKVPNWEAITLPLSYTRPNYVYFNQRISICKEDMLIWSSSQVDYYSAFLTRFPGLVDA